MHKAETQPIRSSAPSLWTMSMVIFFLLQASHSISYPSTKLTESPLSRKILQPVITAILRSRNGALWIGTQHGLYRFDGSKLILFDTHYDSKNMIPVTNIKAIAEDTQGRIFVATFRGGLLILDPASDEFFRANAPATPSVDYLTQLITSGPATIWTGSKEGLYFYTPSGRNIEVTHVAAPKGIGAHEVTALASDDRGNIYVAYGTDLYRITRTENIFEEVFSTSKKDSEAYGSISAIAFDNKNHMYIASETGHIQSIDLTDNSKLSSTKIGGASSTTITSLLFYRDNLWIATNSGLSFANENLKFSKTYNNRNSELKSNHILTLMQDEGFIWVGTYQGLYTLAFVPFETFNEKSSYVFNDVLAFEEDSTERLWVGTYDGLFFFDNKVGQHRRFDELGKPQRLNDRRIMTLAAKNDELWLGFRKGGIQIVNSNTLEITTPPVSQIQDLEVTKILHSKNDRTWIATFNNGLILFEDGITKSFLKNSELPESSITILLEPTEGGLIASSEQRMYQYNASSESFDLLTFQFGDTTLEPLILSISQSSQGNIWIGTKDHGLFVWLKKHQVAGNFDLLQISGSQLKFASTVYGIQFDSKDNAWCSTQAGIVKFDSHGTFLNRFTRADGLQGDDFNFGAFFTDSSGRIYFGGSNGYNRFFPDEGDQDLTPPSLILNQISLSSGGRVEPVRATGITHLQLTHKDYFVKFEFSVLDFLDPDNNTYRYMLEGFDDDWIENGNSNSATYTSLPSGDYVLRVQGANSAGIWNREGLSLTVEVLPPPWFTWWAFTIYACTTILLFWIGKRAYDSYAIEKRAETRAIEMHEAAERADDEMQEQLEIHDDLVKSVHRHNISTLNLIRDFVTTQSAYVTDPVSMEASENNVKRLGALSTLVDCLYHQNENLLADLHQYTDIVISSLLREASVSGEDISTINEVMSQPLPIELASPLAIALYELIENALQHAFEPGTQAHYVQITLRLDESKPGSPHYVLSVQDNGLGIPSTIDPGAYQSSGLAIVESMAGKLSGTLGISRQEGTLVTLTFPATGLHN